MRPIFRLKDIMLLALICALAVATYRVHQAASALSQENKRLCEVQRRLPLENVHSVQLARLPVHTDGYVLFRVRAGRAVSLVGKATDANGVRTISLPIPRDAQWLAFSAQNVDASDRQNVAISVGGRSQAIQVPRLNADITLPNEHENGQLPIQLGYCQGSLGRSIEFFISD